MILLETHVRSHLSCPASYPAGLDRALCSAAPLDDALRQQIHVVLGRVDHLVEQFVQCNKARALDIPMCLLGLVHEVNAVGEPCVEDHDGIGTRVCRQIILRLVHIGFLPACNLPHSGMRLAHPGRFGNGSSGATTCRGALLMT